MATTDRRVVIVGAGIGGISFAIALKQRLGFEGFSVYEQASDVGGTWRDNVYPGCSSDVAIHYFSLSTELKPDWNESHASQPDIQAYWKGLYRKHGLDEHVVLNTKVISAEWDIAEQRYQIVLEDVVSGTTFTTSAHILVTALGILDLPKYPDIPGLSGFRGQLFHSARLNNDAKLSGKRIAVIGNGSSAAQFIPVITKDPNVQVTQFIRTSNWYIESPRKSFSPATKWIFATVPFAMRMYRNFLYLKTEVSYFGLSNKMLRALTTKFALRYMLKTAPAKYYEKLIPDYPLGCKRIIYDNGYLNALHRPNVSLNWEQISLISPNGITTGSGQTLDFDVIILATGFVTDQYNLSVRGKDGETVEQYYQSQHGPTAYLGTTIPGFPNLYTLAGPNTTTGHTSLIFFEEVQIDYCLQLIKPVLAGTVSSFEVTRKATDVYNRKIHAKLDASVWMQCTSWYRTGGEGKISSIFPGSGMHFYRYLRRPTWTHYQAVGGDEWIQSKRVFTVLHCLWFLPLFVLLGWTYSWRVPVFTFHSLGTNT